MKSQLTSTSSSTVTVGPHPASSAMASVVFMEAPPSNPHARHRFSMNSCDCTNAPVENVTIPSGDNRLLRAQHPQHVGSVLLERAGEVVLEERHDDEVGRGAPPGGAVGDGVALGVALAGDHHHAMRRAGGAHR